MTVIGECDPPNGMTRQRQVRYMLIRALNDPWLRAHGQQMNERHDYDSVGLDLTDEMKSRCEVLAALSLLSDPRWQDVIDRHLGPDKQAQLDLAEYWNVSDRTIRYWIEDGIDEIVERVWETH